VSSISKYFGIPCLLHEHDYRLLRQGTMYAIKFGVGQIKIPDHVITFSSGFKVNSDNMTIQIIETPGHTKGGVSYVFDGFIFSGDTLLYKSVGRADLPGSNLGNLKNSVNIILNNHSDDTLIFSGHGIQWSISEAKKWWINGRSSLPQHNMFIKS
jgi:hydroxyacylglutathione hydrolase